MQTLCLARWVVLQLFVQTYHRLLSAFGTSITNAYSTHFVKSSGLNAKAKIHVESLFLHRMAIPNLPEDGGSYYSFEPHSAWRFVVLDAYDGRE
jgi:hypothetical protein